MSQLKHNFLCTAAIAALCCLSAYAVEPPNANDLTQGKWELIPEKSKFCKPAPRKSYREIVDAGWGLISVHWTGIDADGKPIDTWYVLRYDGDKYPADITKPAEEAITWKLVNPRRVEFQHWAKDGRKTEDLVRTVTADGQEMTQTRAYLGEAKECVDIQVFRRI